jgi:hypothetical protein
VATNVLPAVRGVVVAGFEKAARGIWLGTQRGEAKDAPQGDLVQNGPQEGQAGCALMQNMAMLASITDQSPMSTKFHVISGSSRFPLRR